MKHFLIALVCAFMAQTATAKDLYDFSFERLGGGTVNLQDYKNKVLLVVNTANHCGFSTQFEELEKLYSMFNKDGFEIIAISSNDFGQEAGTPEEVKTYLNKNFNVSFPVMQTTHVVGENVNPFYAWVNGQAGEMSVKWNFHKYLFDRSGQFAGAFPSLKSPMSREIIESVGILLSEEE